MSSASLGESGGGTRHTARILESEDDKRAWREIAEHPAFGSMTQCFWWADPLGKAGVRTTGIGLWNEDRLVGGGLFRSIPVPYVGAHLTQCRGGPLHLSWEPQSAESFVSKVVELADDHNSLEVAIHECASPQVQRDILEAFQRRRLKVVVAAAFSDAVVSLKESSLDDIFRRMNERTRRSIRKAEKNGVQVRALTSNQELRGAHGAWMATAMRKGFTDIRPWELLEPVLRYSIGNGLGAVYGSFMGDQLLAAIFVTFIGAQASYVYGGFLDGCDRHHPNHILHFEAIKQSLERGLLAYNLGQLISDDPAERGGLDQFKLGFGALVQKRPNSIVWKRRPLLSAALAWVRRQKLGRTLVEAFKRRLLDPQRQQS